MCEVLDKVENRGIERGEKRFATLVTKLLADGRTEDLQKAASNKKIRNKFYKEYGITC